MKPAGGALPRGFPIFTLNAPTIMESERQAATLAMRRIRSAAYNVVRGTGKLTTARAGQALQ
jgi:hypothetical protein